MFAFTLFRANRAVRRIEVEVTQQGYRAGLHQLPNQSTSWILAQVERIAQRFEKHRGSSTTLREQIIQLEDRLAKTKDVARVHQTQINLVPGLSRCTKLSRVLVILGFTYLVGTGLSYWLGTELLLSEWLTLAVSAALLAGPWALGVPVLARRRAQLDGWRTARLVRRQERQLHRLTRRLETLRHREAYIARWTTKQIAALEQVYAVAYEAARKAQQYSAQLDWVPPPTVTFADLPEPPAPKPHLYQTNGTRVDHPIDLIATGRD